MQQQRALLHSRRRGITPRTAFAPHTDTSSSNTIGTTNANGTTNNSKHEALNQNYAARAHSIPLPLREPCMRHDATGVRNRGAS